MNPNRPYRPDIDGLRAIAVLAVVFFHAFPTWVRGGFVGVDIFFVISGFLITDIIKQKLDHHSFTFSGFYAARIRRIFPALITLLLSCLAIGWFVLLADEYARLGKHVAGGAGFITNFLLWQESGYFDATAETKPLLHLWSLGIEEQFYILWPLLLWITHKLRRSLVIPMAVIGIGSFAANMYLANTDHIADFYSPVSRFWELMLGAALTWWKPRHKAVSFLGLAIILAAIFGFNIHMEFPSWRVLLPTIGAALLIAAQPQSVINRKILSHPALVWVGLISYPLYLWHWPLLSFVRIFEDAKPSTPLRFTVLATSVILAWATYRLIEKPIRFGKHNSNIVAILCVLMLTVGGLGYIVFDQRGIAERAIVEANQRNFYNVDTVRKNILKQYKPTPCDFDTSLVPDSIKSFCTRYGNPDAKKLVVIWGDSHAESWSIDFFKLADEQKNFRVVMFSHGGCPPLLNIHRNGTTDNAQNCRDPSQAATIIDTIHKLNPDIIALIARWELYTTGMGYNTSMDKRDPFLMTSEDGEPTRATAEKSLSDNFLPTVQAIANIAPVLIIKNPPVLLGDINQAITAQASTHYKDSLTAIEPAVYQHMMLNHQSYHLIDEAAKLPRVTVFDPTTILCTDTCKAVKDGTIMYRDDSHPSAEGVLLFTPYLQTILESIFAQ